MKIFNSLCFLLLAQLLNVESYAQGCVAIRSIGGLCTMEHAGMHEGDMPKWNLNVNIRHFKSYKHFNGTEEQKYRFEEGSEVINFSSVMDVSIQRTLNEKWSLAVNVPILYYKRSSKYEHLGNTSDSRFITSAKGIGDARITAYRWLISPAKNKKMNLLGGLGLKIPTGNYKAKDIFHYQPDATRIGYVDQSIQPGDGGWGITAELNTFISLNKNWSLYGSGFYLFNPRDNNGVSTARGGTPTAAAIKYTSDVMSVADQYMVRSGVNYTKKNVTGSIGARFEAIPSCDLIGKSTGFRRPGNILSIEPGLTYMYKKYNFFIYSPIAIRRERPQSYPDRLKSIDTNVFSRGDAAFADFSINVGMSLSF